MIIEDIYSVCFLYTISHTKDTYRLKTLMEILYTSL